MNSVNGCCGSINCSNFGLLFSLPGCTNSAPISMSVAPLFGMEAGGLRVEHDVCVDRLVERFDAARIATVDIAFPIHFCCVSFHGCGSVRSGWNQRFFDGRTDARLELQSILPLALRRHRAVGVGLQPSSSRSSPSVRGDSIRDMRRVTARRARVSPESYPWAISLSLWGCRLAYALPTPQVYHTCVIFCKCLPTFPEPNRRPCRSP